MSLRSLNFRLVGALALVFLLLLSACGTSGNSDSSYSGSFKGQLTVASKLDIESQLLAKMYTLLLRKEGFQINEKPALGNSTIIFQAITYGSIDLYPEFTGTGLNRLHIPSTYNPLKDYQMVKDDFKKKYKLTWLDPTLLLNDGYTFCTMKENAQMLGLVSISDIVPKVSQLTLTTPSDATPFVDGLKRVYKITTRSFKSVKTIDYALGFEAVKNGKAQITVCYSTDANVPQSGFIFLKDDKNGFPPSHPAPLVRSNILQRYPDISRILNPLAPKLTTDVSIQLQIQVTQKKNEGASVFRAVTLVATDFLKREGLL